MSRIASRPVTIPSGVTVTLKNNQSIEVKGPKGQLTFSINPFVLLTVENDSICIARNEAVKPKKEQRHMALSICGTTCALIRNMLIGVQQGFEKRLQLVGVGYRAQSQGNILNLTLGYSHPVNFVVPEGISIETPEQTVIVVKGLDKQLVGQVAANIRGYRPPEPYKGKGVRYTDEVVRRKESKKK
ncbi:MAG: 50S ribosomal protein L6 [Gammaproteobacteria bacterium]|nr:50S ribosomal protein L6 [Gammaproteobacteria bacterium]